MGLLQKARVVLVAAVLLAGCAACSAQSCALCYTQAAGSGHRMIRGLRRGIITLMVPPMFMSVGITVLAYRKRNRTNDPKDLETRSNEW